MNTQEWFRNKLESFKEDFDFRLETLILDLTETISKKIEENNLNRTKLAELLGVSPPAVTKILNGNSNFTLRTLLALADALELDLKIEFKEKGIIASQKMVIYTSMPSLSPSTSSSSTTDTSNAATAGTANLISFPKTGEERFAEAV